MALNQLSRHAVGLPPLQPSELRKACASAFAAHSGPTEAVSSCVNGGGKSHAIMRAVAERQAAGEAVLYARVPMRESTTSASLVALLASARARCRAVDVNAAACLHLDIAHIIPPSANTMLFELLLVGLLRDPASCRMYHRFPRDTFKLEMPNSPGNKSAAALRFCSLIPSVVLPCVAETFDLQVPTAMGAGSIRLVEYSEAVFVCKVSAPHTPCLCTLFPHTHLSPLLLISVLNVFTANFFFLDDNKNLKSFS